ncbi:MULTISPECIES: hypothetical protein [unclassified Actinomyces]|uniref:hypothetical protein n=1 Tax=unclassified Actinomyces TaxID=2609248 RepID=UPI001373A71A|nr:MULTISPECIES: hypothetical protein [unclassified Actinomyces]NDR52662.1 hypothetical protein [Actinomyces sp. 565]QHO90898.1 hypothetical protein CWT12_05560 [Actinomyces sp. 432]
MSIDWSSLGLVTLVTVAGAAFILAVTSAAVRMLAAVRLKRQSGQVKGLHLAEVAAGFFIACVVGIAVFGLWLLIPYFH